MFKIFSILIFFLLLNACSVDPNLSFWKNKEINSKERQLADFSFNENISFDDYKNNVIEYGKKSNFPELMD